MEMDKQHFHRYRIRPVPPIFLQPSLFLFLPVGFRKVIIYVAIHTRVYQASRNDGAHYVPFC